MGSNFDHIEADVGIIIEEKGKQKIGDQNLSALYGKLSLQDYATKFSKTTIGFSLHDITGRASLNEDAGGLYLSPP